MVSGFQIACANKIPQDTIVHLGDPMSHQDAIYKLIGNKLRLHIFVADVSFDMGVRGDIG
jgi:hypothetical protein